MGGAGSYNGTSSKAAIATQPWANGLSALTVEAGRQGRRRRCHAEGSCPPARPPPRRIRRSASPCPTRTRAGSPARPAPSPSSSAPPAAPPTSRRRPTAQSTAAQCLAGVWASGQPARLYRRWRADRAQQHPGGDHRHDADRHCRLAVHRLVARHRLLVGRDRRSADSRLGHARGDAAHAGAELPHPDPVLRHRRGGHRHRRQPVPGRGADPDQRAGRHRRRTSTSPPSASNPTASPLPPPSPASPTAAPP